MYLPASTQDCVLGCLAFTLGDGTQAESATLSLIVFLFSRGHGRSRSGWSSPGKVCESSSVHRASILSLHRGARKAREFGHILLRRAITRPNGSLLELVVRTWRTCRRSTLQIRSRLRLAVRIQPFAIYICTIRSAMLRHRGTLV